MSIRSHWGEYHELRTGDVETLHVVLSHGAILDRPVEEIEDREHELLFLVCHGKKRSVCVQTTHNKRVYDDDDDDDHESDMFFCGISGEPPQDPVVSSKSGHVYERRLILKYITENGTDPLTGEKLDESDLLTIKASTSTPFRSLARHLDRPHAAPLQTQRPHHRVHPPPLLSLHS